MDADHVQQLVLGPVPLAGLVSHDGRGGPDAEEGVGDQEGALTTLVPIGRIPCPWKGRHNC